jgi:regulator of sigma E protease
VPDERQVVSSISRYSWLFLLGILIALVLAKWTLLVAVLGLAFLITMHEFGHYLAAKAFGMRVEKFYVGFPPAAVKRTWGETEYGIGLVPLGGFCKISGMTEDEVNHLEDDVQGRAYYHQKVWKRNVAIAAGPAMNFVAAVLILLVFYLVQGEPKLTLTVSVVKAGTPAAAAGLHVGDTLVGADGLRWRTWDAAAAFLQSHPGRTIALVYRPKGTSVERSTLVTLTTNPGDHTKGYLGVGAGETARRSPPWRAARLAVTGTGFIVKETFVGIGMLVSGKINPIGSGGVAGPVGIVSISETAVQQHTYLWLLAFLSVNLGIINLIPMLPFDGGHILFNTIERIRGRRVEAKVLERVVAFGVALLVVLFVFITWHDIARLVR